MASPTTEHCNDCGSTEYEDLYGWDDEEWEGYTACCNKRLCYEAGCIVEDGNHTNRTKENYFRSTW